MAYTQQQAMERFIKAFDTALPELSDYKYWEKLCNGVEWIKKTYPDSDIGEVAEQYHKALFLIACIKHEIINERGKHFDSGTDV